MSFARPFHALIQLGKNDWNQNILDLVFSNDELIASVESRNFFMSDHNIVCSETNLPVSRMPTSTHNEPASRFESIDLVTGIE